MAESKRHIRELLAELEHEQWIEWAKNLMDRESLGSERIERWKKLMIPYSQLTEEQKDQDRIWADKSLIKLHSQGVVIKVDRELPEECQSCFYTDELGNKISGIHELASYIAVEPLI